MIELNPDANDPYSHITTFTQHTENLANHVANRWLQYVRMYVDGKRVTEVYVDGIRVYPISFYLPEFTKTLVTTGAFEVNISTDHDFTHFIGFVPGDSPIYCVYINGVPLLASIGAFRNYSYGTAYNPSRSKPDEKDQIASTFWWNEKCVYFWYDAPTRFFTGEEVSSKVLQKAEENEKNEAGYYEYYVSTNTGPDPYLQIAWTMVYGNWRRE